MKTKAKLKLPQVEKIIRKYGYEYHLVECPERGSWKLPNACALGFPGWSLKSVNKIKQ